MFARWGALVYRFRKFIVVFSVLLAIASLSLASQTSGALSSGGWLDNNSESAEVQRRLDEEFGAGKGSLIALFRSDDAAADARSPEFQAAIAGALADLAADERVTGVVGYAETGDDRFISTAGDAAYVVVQLGDLERGVRRAGRGAARGDPAAGRVHVPADGLRPADRGLGRAVREGPATRRDRLAADRGPRPAPRLRLGSRGRHAAARRRPGDPRQPRAHLPRRAAGRDEHLRPQHRDDARPRPGDRLLAVHHQPLPGGAAPRADRRRGRRALGRHGRQGGRLLRARGRDRAVRAAALRRPGHPLDRHRRLDRRPDARCSSR